MSSARSRSSSQSRSDSKRQIEVTLLNIANGGEYTVILPEGAYHVVASTEGMETKEYEVTIPSDGALPIALSHIPAA